MDYTLLGAAVALFISGVVAGRLVPRVINTFTSSPGTREIVVAVATVIGALAAVATLVVTLIMLGGMHPPTDPR